MLVYDFDTCRSLLESSANSSTSKSFCFLKRATCVSRSDCFDLSCSRDMSLATLPGGSTTCSRRLYDEFGIEGSTLLSKCQSRSTSRAMRRSKESVGQEACTMHAPPTARRTLGFPQVCVGVHFHSIRSNAVAGDKAVVSSY